ncbi:GRIP1-associated protein 1, partial [Genypterus blacodes]|uniref:GRIP1-associated protein 1 n=1 Tax=Genypterus blacodes TaxID=154954 RepID=UPI003F771AC7
LCTQIEQLEHENQGFKEGGGASAVKPVSDSAPCPVDGQLLHLQAENSALQKKLTALQERYNKDLPRPAVAQGNHSTTTETDGPTCTNRVADVTVRGEESEAEGTNERLEQMEAQLELKPSQFQGLSEKSVEKIVAKQAALGWSAALCPITHCFGPELEMALTTEQEEKRLLREQVHNMETSKQAEVTKLQDEITKLSDKLKKKQER